MSVMGLTPLETAAIWAVFGVAILGLAYAVFLRSQILREDKGTPQMQEVWNAIKEGADAYLRRQLRSILPLIGILTIALFLSVYIVPPTPEAQERFPGLTDAELKLWIGIARGLAFIMGAGFSLAVGQIGMRMAIEGNVRVASASKRSFGDALRIAYRAGTITGMLTDGLGLLGGTIIFIVLGIAAPDALLGFGFGGTLLALFMRVVVVFSPRPQMWAQIWSVRWKQASLRMIQETLPSSRILWEITSATVQVWLQISSNPMK
jgi:K(+)-stimulated pyrophosphate-energized sodium pump